MSLAFFFSSSSRCRPQHCRTKDWQINRVGSRREKNASFVRILNALLTKFPYLITTRVQIGTETESAAVFIHLLNLSLLLNFCFSLLGFYSNMMMILMDIPIRRIEPIHFHFHSFVQREDRQKKNYGEMWWWRAHFTIYASFYELSNISGSDKRRKLIFPLWKLAIVPMQMGEWWDLWRVLSLHELRQLAHHFLERFAICFHFFYCVPAIRKKKETPRKSRYEILERIDSNPIQFNIFSAAHVHLISLANEKNCV